MKFNMYRCRHIEQKVTTTYYPNPNPNHKKNLNEGLQTLTLILTLQSAQKHGGLWL